MGEDKNAIESLVETVATNPDDEKHRDERPPQTIEAEPTSNDPPEQVRRD